MLGQGAEHENAMDRIVPVDFIDGGHESFLGHIFGQLVLLDGDAHQLGPLGGALLIGQIARVGATANDGQGGDDPLFFQSCGTLHELFIEGIGHFFAQ